MNITSMANGKKMKITIGKNVHVVKKHKKQNILIVIQIIFVIHVLENYQSLQMKKVDVTNL